EISRIMMTQTKPQFLQTLDPELALAAFGLKMTDWLDSAPVQVVSTGTPQLMIPVRDHDALRRAQVDAARYTALREQANFFSPHLFCLGGATAQGATFARHFGVPPDAPEDPFTGSASGGMGAYLWRYGLVANPTFVAEQGHWMGRPGLGWVEVIGPPQDIETVKVGGATVVTLRGELVV
ncbi:MAG TPA: PhzF family phenazine biosynthesis protein, partial [Anaerolineales bacterium]|nr:PhzF family phenazine biosynthesis protein [Anaerolineales bacterium]